MKKQVIDPDTFTWIVRKQLNCCGGAEYMIEVKELNGCISYGETIAEAKKGLEESIKLWYSHHKKENSLLQTNTKVIHLEPNMTKEEFEQINQKLIHILLK